MKMWDFCEQECFFISYKNYVAKIYFDFFDDIFVGEVINCEDIICFHASTLKEIEEHFHNQIDDYLKFKSMVT